MLTTKPVLGALSLGPRLHKHSSWSILAQPNAVQQAAKDSRPHLARQ